MIGVDEGGSNYVLVKGRDQKQAFIVHSKRRSAQKSTELSIAALESCAPATQKKTYYRHSMKTGMLNLKSQIRTTPASRLTLYSSAKAGRRRTRWNR